MRNVGDKFMSCRMLPSVRPRVSPMRMIKITNIVAPLLQAVLAHMGGAV